MDSFYMKFRAWDYNQKKMYYIKDGLNRYFQFYENGKWSLLDDDLVLTSNIESNIHNGVIMQYIGWEDIYKNNIYFGDIVKYEKDSPTEPFESGTAIIIRGLNGGAGISRSYDQTQYFVKQGKVEMHTYADLDGIGEDIWDDDEIYKLEVVGNIFENANYINH